MRNEDDWSPEDDDAADLAYERERAEEAERAMMQLANRLQASQAQNAAQAAALARIAGQSWFVEWRDGRRQCWHCNLFWPRPLTDDDLECVYCIARAALAAVGVGEVSE